MRKEDAKKMLNASTSGSGDQSSSHAPATPCLPDDFDAVLQAATPLNALAEYNNTPSVETTEHPGRPKSVSAMYSVQIDTPVPTIFSYYRSSHDTYTGKF